MRHIRKKWKQHFIADNWRDFVKRFGVPAELALRGEDQEVVATFYDSDDMVIQKNYRRARVTRSQSAREREREEEKAVEKKTFRRATFGSEGDETTDDEMVDVCEARKGKRNVSAVKTGEKRMRKKARYS